MEYTSYEELLALRTKLLKTYKSILEDCQRLEHAVSRLEASFADDGIDEIKANCENIYRGIGESKEALLIIAGALKSAAELMKEAKELTEA